MRIEEVPQGFGEFDVVLSFSVHACADGIPFSNPALYFEKCVSLVRPAGWLVIEFHSADFECQVGGVAITRDLLSSRFHELRFSKIEDVPGKLEDRFVGVYTPLIGRESRRFLTSPH